MSSTVIKCAQCGQANRVPDLGSGKKAVCGRCKAPLGGGGAPVVATDAGFQQLVASGKTLVDFWAAWCGPCHAIAPTVEAVARERSDVKVAKLNVDENPQTSAQFRVTGIPTLIFFVDGQEKDRLVGAVSRAEIDRAMQRAFG